MIYGGGRSYRYPTDLTDPTDSIALAGPTDLTDLTEPTAPTDPNSRIDPSHLWGNQSKEKLRLKTGADGRASRTVGQVGSSANGESSPLSGRLAVVMFFHQYLSIFVQPWHARTSPSLHAMPRPSSRKRCEWHVSGMLSRHESNAKKHTFFIRTEAYNLHM